MVNIILSIDNRETDFINLYKSNKEHIDKDIIINFENLAIGDFYIFINDKLEYIIERKTLNDLHNSISDGRYKEQKERLKEYSDRCKPFYIIENYRSASEIIEYSGYETSIKRVYGALLSISLSDKFPIFYTKNLDDTYYLIFSFLNKIKSNPSKFMNTGENNKTKETDMTIQNLILKERSANISSSNIIVLMLAQIPTISIISAQAIAREHNNSLGILIDKLREYPDKEARKKYIENIKSNNRRLGKRVAENVVNFLNID